jgi:hypothetical protein
MKAKKIAITSASAFVDLPNAQRHLSHYFGCSGSPLEIDLVSMVDDVPSAKQAFDKELSEAMTFVESLGPGPRVISSTNASQGFNRKSENKDWYYAIGGYKYWGGGQACVGSNSYILHFEYKITDRYNWDKGKKVTIPLIGEVSDRFMGEFHRMGLAKEFDINGSMKKTVTWKKGMPPTIKDE